MVLAPRQIKQAGVKMIQTLNPGMESNRLKTGARQNRANNSGSDIQLSEIYQGVKEERISSTTALNVQTAAGMMQRYDDGNF